jgi:hypothetical protein
LQTEKMSFAFDGVGLPPELWASILACSDISVIARYAVCATQANETRHFDRQHVINAQ